MLTLSEIHNIFKVYIFDNLRKMIIEFVINFLFLKYFREMEIRQKNTNENLAILKQINYNQ